MKMTQYFSVHEHAEKIVIKIVNDKLANISLFHNCKSANFTNFYVSVSRNYQSLTNVMAFNVDCNSL